MNTLRTSLFLLGASITCATACSRESSSPPPTQQDTLAPFMRPVAPLIQEASGMVASSKNKNHLWVLEDSGNPPNLIYLAYDGTWQKKMYIKGTTNRDWEAMALANDSIFVGDIGDNAQVFGEYFIYRFAEPTGVADTIKTAEKLVFRYSDGAHDAEAMFVADGNIYIITKRDAQSGIYKISPPFSTGIQLVATKVGSLPYSGVVDASISGTGNMILVKTYGTINRYNRGAGMNVETALQQTPVKLPYMFEPQGETVTMRPDAPGYFTLSESAGGSLPQLYFYPLK